MKRIKAYIEEHEGVFELLEGASNSNNDDLIENLMINKEKKNLGEIKEDNDEGIDINIEERNMNN